MYAVMEIDHKPGDALGPVAAAVKAVHNPAVVLARSQYSGAREMPYGAPGLYAGETLSWDVICFATSATLQVIIAARGGSLKDACRDVWELLRSTMKEMEPRLGRLKLIDPGTPEPIATATTGLRPHLRRSDVQIAVYPGLVTVIVVAIIGLSGLITGHRLGDLVIGGAPAVLVTVVAFALVTSAAYSHSLAWQQ